jgi:hypothetical protein
MRKNRMIAEPLPYDMGNSGDLIKHGMIAEFTKWWASHNKSPFIFYDPFGGRPWVEPPHKKVTERLAQLKDCALAEAQPIPDIRYYGSGHIIKEIARYAGTTAKVLVSDRNEDAIYDLVRSGLERIDHEEFISENAYSILDCNLSCENANLLLLDPFADFLESYETLLPKVIELVAKNEVTIALFVLSDDSTSLEYENFNNLRRPGLAGKTMQFSFSCPPLQNTGIEGEERYRSDVILFMPEKHRTLQLDGLKQNLKQYVGMLTQVLNQKIQFND